MSDPKVDFLLGQLITLTPTDPLGLNGPSDLIDRAHSNNEWLTKGIQVLGEAIQYDLTDVDKAMCDQLEDLLKARLKNARDFSALMAKYLTPPETHGLLPKP